MSVWPLEVLADSAAVIAQSYGLAMHPVWLQTLCERQAVAAMRITAHQIADAQATYTAMTQATGDKDNGHTPD